MPEAVQGSLPIEPAAPAAVIAPKPAAPVRKFVLPAESVKTEVKAPPPAAAAEAAQNTEEQAPSAEPEGDKPESKEAETPEQAAKRQGRRFERKLDKAYRERAEALARAEHFEKQLNERAPQAQADTGAPKLEQFDYDPEKYAKALAEHETKKAEKGWADTRRNEEARKKNEVLVSAWEEKSEKASDKYDDFATVVGELKPVNVLTAAVMKVDADVAYHLAKTPKEAERIANLDPVDQILEIGRLEAKLLAKPEKPKMPSKAPEPIKPLSGSGATVTDVPSEKDDMKDWMRKRQKQVHGKR